MSFFREYDTIAAMNTPNKIVSMDKHTVLGLREEIDEALRTLGEKYGLKIHAGKCRYGATSAEFALEASIINSAGVALTPELVAMKRRATMWGTTEAKLEEPIKLFGKTYTLTGFVSCRPRYPFLASCHEDGKTYKFSAASVAVALKLPVNAIS